MIEYGKHFVALEGVRISLHITICHCEILNKSIMNKMGFKIAWVLCSKGVVESRSREVFRSPAKRLVTRH